MVFTATRMTSTFGRPAAQRPTARTILLTSTDSSEPLRLRTLIPLAVETLGQASSSAGWYCNCSVVIDAGMPVTSKLGHQARQETRGRAAASGCSPSALPRSLGTSARRNALFPAGLRTYRRTTQTYLPQLPSLFRPVLFLRRSFLLTAAGQPRIHTRFPFHHRPEVGNGEPATGPSIWGMTGRLQHSWMNVGEEWKRVAKVAGETSRPPSLLPGVWTVSEQPDAVQHALFERYWPRRSRIQTRSRR